MVKKLLILLSISSICFADQVANFTFRGLNNNENSVIISPEYAQDLLNVDITPGGKSVKKRDGYGVYKNIDVGAVHGGHHFFDATGNDVQVWGSSDNLKGIVADGTPTTLVSSATLNSTWDCADVQGNAYCVNSNRDALIKTTGATMTWYTSPAGTMVEATPTRLVIGGVSGALSSLYVSEDNNFTNFTVANLNTSPFIEPLAAPGSKLTHLRWACGKLLWWKDQSFGYTNFEDQFTLENRIISDTIGTIDNTSAMDPGGNVWFRGQDGHIWRYDCSALTKESIEITPYIQTSGRRTANLFVQSSQSEWQVGSSSPTSPYSPLSFTVSPGDVIPGSFTVTENTSAQWNAGTTSGISIFTSSYSVTPASAPVADPSFENGTPPSVSASWTIQSDDPGSTWIQTASHSKGSCTVLPNRGAYFVRSSGMGSQNPIARIIRASDNQILTSRTFGSGLCDNTCTWSSGYLSSTSDIGTAVKLQFVNPFSGASSTMTTTNSFVLTGDVAFKYLCDGGGSSNAAYFDNIQNSTTTATFTSQAFNAGLPYSFFMASATWSAGDVSPAFVLQKSANGSTWLEINRSSGSNVQSNVQYVRYITTMTAYAFGTNSHVTGVNILARSSGTYFSQVKNAPNISAWSTFNPTYTDNGDDINFYIRSSTGVFQNGVLTSTPAWVAQTPNALVSASTGTYFQVIASFTVTAATNTPSILSDFTVNWFDGSASDQAYMHYFDNAIWASVAFGVGVSSNTYIFRRDLINDGWVIYNFGTGGFLTQNNRLYFGDVSSSGNVFIFGSGTSDNSTAINSYWKSKDFTGADPFLESSLTKIDTFAKKDQGQSLTATYTLNTSTSTSFSIALSSTTQSIIQNRKNLPNGKNGYTFNIQYGDSTTTSSWELFGYRITFNPLPWVPSN